MEVLDEADFEIFAFISRGLWLRRNTFVFGGKFSSPFHTLQQGLATLEEFRCSALRLSPSREASPSPATLLWQKPQQGMLKANWDAGVDVQGNRMAVGVLFRDDGGRVVAAMCSVVPGITDPMVAEALGLWKAVLLGLELGVQSLHLEGDAQTIVQALQHPGPCWSHFGHLIEATRTALTGFPHWTISHTMRSANGAAHKLAKNALCHSLNFVWRDSYPVFLTPIVLAKQGVSS